MERTSTAPRPARRLPASDCDSQEDCKPCNNAGFGNPYICAGTVAHPTPARCHAYCTSGSINDMWTSATATAGFSCVALQEAAGVGCACVGAKYVQNLKGVMHNRQFFPVPLPQQSAATGTTVDGIDTSDSAVTHTFTVGPDAHYVSTLGSNENGRCRECWQPGSSQTGGFGRGRVVCQGSASVPTPESCWGECRAHGLPGHTCGTGNSHGCKCVSGNNVTVVTVSNMQSSEWDIVAQHLRTSEGVLWTTDDGTDQSTPEVGQCNCKSARAHGPGAVYLPDVGGGRHCTLECMDGYYHAHAKRGGIYGGANGGDFSWGAASSCSSNCVGSSSNMVFEDEVWTNLYCVKCTNQVCAGTASDPTPPSCHAFCAQMGASSDPTNVQHKSRFCCADWRLPAASAVSANWESEVYGPGQQVLRVPWHSSSSGADAERSFCAEAFGLPSGTVQWTNEGTGAVTSTRAVSVDVASSHYARFAYDSTAGTDNGGHPGCICGVNRFVRNGLAPASTDDHACRECDTQGDLRVCHAQARGGTTERPTPASCHATCASAATATQRGVTWDGTSGGGLYECATIPASGGNANGSDDCPAHSDGTAAVGTACVGTAVAHSDGSTHPTRFGCVCRSEYAHYVK